MTTELFRRRPLEGIGFYLVGGVAALGIHGAVSVGAANLPPADQAVSRVEMAVVKTKPPPPPEPEPPPPEPEPKPKKIARAQPKDVVKPPPNQPPQPPPTDKPRKPIPIVTGISLNSTVSGGAGIAVRAGNTLYGDIEKEKFVPAEEVRPYEYVPVRTHEITEEPEVLKEVKAEMPESAKNAGIQGTVVLKVEVKSDGTVRRVTVVKGLGYGLDKAAVNAMKRFKFKPAKKNGKPVDYTISRFYYVFELVD